MVQQERKNEHGDRGGRKAFNKKRPANEFEQKIIDLARVTRVMAGGKRMRFRACVAMGDRKGQVGWGLAKGADVALAVAKAVNQAKKKMLRIKLVNDTLPHQIEVKYKAAKILLKPAPQGRGIIAGGPVRTVLELAGITNVYGKILGNSSSKINNVRATFKALSLLQYPEQEAVEKVTIEQISSDEPTDIDFDEQELLEKEQAQLLKKAGIDLNDIKNLKAVK